MPTKLILSFMKVEPIAEKILDKFEVDVRKKAVFCMLGQRFVRSLLPKVT